MTVIDYITLIEPIRALWRWLWAWKFRRIFGKDAGDNYHIIYYQKYVQDRRTVFISPEPKVKRSLYRHSTNLTTINSCATTRSIGHLVYSFGTKVKTPPAISSDFDTDEKMDISFISIGGVTNLKSCDVLKEVSCFLNFSGDSIKHGDSKLITAALPDTDCGFIIKVHPSSNPKRTWLCCAGVGEWGTSGAAWFLAMKWKDICKWAKDKPFAIITKTAIGSDESTQLVHRFLTPEEIEDVIRKTTSTVTKTTTKTETERSTSTAAPSASM